MSPETPFRKGRRSMSRRSGQDGSISIRNNQYVGRYYEDTAEGRTRRAMILGSVKEMSKPEAKRRLREIISRAGVNEVSHLEQALGTARTFSDAVKGWERTRLPKLSLSSQYQQPKLIARHLTPFFGSMALDAIRTGTVNEWIGTRMKEYQPKTVHNMYRLFRAVVGGERLAAARAQGVLIGSAEAPSLA